MSMEDLKRFILALQADKSLLEKVSDVATANEIASVAGDIGFNFTGAELKSISNQNVEPLLLRRTSL